MSTSDNDHSKDNRGVHRLPQWAGYLLVAVDVVRTRLFLIPWVGTLIALSMTLPLQSIWLWIGVLVFASIATLAGVTRAVATQANQRGALGAYVGRLAAGTNFGRWLTDFLSGSSR